MAKPKSNKRQTLGEFLAMHEKAPHAPTAATAPVAAVAAPQPPPSPPPTNPIPPGVHNRPKDETAFESRDWNGATVDAVLDHMHEGMSLVAIAKLPGMPSRGRVIFWVADDERGTAKGKFYEGIAKRYRLAQIIRTEVWAEECLQLSDDSEGDYKTRINRMTGQEEQYFDREHFERVRLKVQTRLNFIQRMNAVYGPKKATKFASTMENEVDPSEMTDQQMIEDAIAKGNLNQLPIEVFEIYQQQYLTRAKPLNELPAAPPPPRHPAPAHHTAAEVFQPIGRGESPDDQGRVPRVPGEPEGQPAAAGATAFDVLRAARGPTGDARVAPPHSPDGGGQSLGQDDIGRH